ncbi:chemotaxis protein CheX [Bremerella sp. T1]|uniref:chemotaxis protein CheX n=1 Tax=Bremerella sp. TYQ1 TaxID=3119568 RepID=UPI001CCFFE2E|nr:chemotaxis protein CheX [Bremerella volcania]UBM37529.1 chemotaxis protein CheX [Bremerella volcania]
MSTVVDNNAGLAGTNSVLAEAVVHSVENALTMCGTSARCVGVARVPLRENGLVTGIIGVHGRVSGFITVNMSEMMAIGVVEGLLQEEFGKLTSQVVDGAGEVTNMICGGIKSQLSKTSFSFQGITVPSIIVGEGYQMAFARGLEFVSATFEHDNPEAVMLDDRLLAVSMCFLKL